MSDDPFDDRFKDQPDPDGASFSDEELEAALAGFEKEFQESGDEPGGEDGKPAGDSGSGSAADGAAADADADGHGDADASSVSSGFEDELAGLLGNKAKVAVIITRLTSARLLAAFCQLSDISADCIDSQEGAVAVLRNLDGDGPEAAAKDLTTVVSGMSVILAVNRADKLEATLYMMGDPGQTFAPPVLFSATAPFVEDLMLGITTMDGLADQGTASIASSSLDHDQAMQVIAEHTRFGRGGSSIQ